MIFKLVGLGLVDEFQTIQHLVKLKEIVFASKDNVVKFIATSSASTFMLVHSLCILRECSITFSSVMPYIITG